MDLYSYPTNVIATFYSLSISGTVIGGYLSITLIMSYQTFFFNKKMACSSSISAFMASTLNLIMKFTVFHFPYLKDSILYSVSAVFVLLLNVIFISLTNSSQSWVLSSLSSSSSFFYVYIPATPPLRWARITVILSLISIILLLLRNNCIPLYQSLNFVWSPLNHPGSGTMLFDITAYIFLFSGTDISVFVCSYLFEVSSLICRDPSHSNNTLILSVLLELVLVPLCSLHYIYFVQQMVLSNFVHGYYPLHFSCKVSLLMLLPNVIIFTHRAQVVLRPRLENGKGCNRW